MSNQASDLNPRRAALKQEQKVASSSFAETLAIGALWGLLLSGVVTEVLGQTYLVSFGFYTLHVVDPAIVLVFSAWAAYQIERPLRGGLIIIPACLITVLVLTNFVRGLSVGANAALIYGRGSLVFPGLLMLGMTCLQSNKLHQAMRNSLLTAASLIAGLSFLRQLFGPALFMTYSVADVSEINDGGRALSSSGAFIIALGATLLLSDLLRAPKLRSLGKFAWFTILVLLEIGSGQGTATLAMLAMLAVLLIVERGPYHSLRLSISVLVLAVCSAMLVLGGIDSILEGGGGSFNFAQRFNNLDTRTTVWEAFMVGFKQESLLDQLIGMAAGQRPSVIVYLSSRLYDWQVSVHSMYYGSLLMMGYIGLCAYILLLVTLITGLLFNALGARSKSFPAYPLAMCIGTAVLSISYEVRTSTLLGLFASIWWYRSNRQRGQSARISPQNSTTSRRIDASLPAAK